MKSQLLKWSAVMGAGALMLVGAGSIASNAQQKITDPYIPNDHGSLQFHSDKRQGAHQHSPALQRKSARKNGLICPVTGDKIASVKASVGHTAYKGKTYYFCCADCKPRFDKAPARFVKNAAAGKYAKM